MRRQGVTRRSFLKDCSLAATSLGLGAGMAPKIAWALENKPRIPAVRITVWNAPAVPNLLSARSPTGEGRHPFPDFPRLRR
ncbi:twin-arginine translocation signal domain-containing protein [Shigella sonnei]